LVLKDTGNTTAEHLEVLHQLGFTRVSYGVQDYDLRVQTAIHRFQPFEQVKQVTELSRKLDIPLSVMIWYLDYLFRL
jgi:coproporphyrinogen III oxidase-like Fe-S oxidoreductase